MNPLRPEDLDLSGVERSPFGHLRADSVEKLLQRAAWAYREALAENQRLGQTVEQLTQRVEELTMQVASLEEATARYKEREELARTLLASAQRAARDERESARQEAELILKKAARRARQLEQKVKRIEAEHRSELARLDALRDDTVVRLRRTLEKIIDWDQGSNDAQHLSDRPRSRVRHGEDAGQVRDAPSGGTEDPGQSALSDACGPPGVGSGTTIESEQVEPGKREPAGEDENEHRETRPPHWPEHARGKEHRVAAPRSWGKWATSVAALVVIAAVVFFAMRMRHHPSVPRGALSQTSAYGPTTPAHTALERTAKSRNSTTPLQSHVTRGSSGRVVLTLRALGTTWVEVRDSSSTGSLLYSGTLSPGARKSFRAPWRLWVRFGGAANLAVTLDGRALRVPTGTYNAFFDAHGFRQTT